MENLNYIQRNIKIFVIFSCIFIFGTFQSCRDDVTDDIITEEILQVASFLEQNPADFFEFFRLVEDAGLYDALSTYGAYTCFIPNNAAVLKYYENNGIVSYEDLDKATKEDIVKNHIIRGGTGTSPIQALDFPTGYEISTPNLNNNFLITNMRVETEENPYRYVVNDSANIITFDIGLVDDPNDPDQIKIHNGIVHMIDKVLEAPADQLVELLNENPKFENFTLFRWAFERTSMIDSLSRSKTDYVDPGPQQSHLDYEITNGTAPYNSPPDLRYGYTVLMENDATLLDKLGLSSVEDTLSFAKKVAELYGTTPEVEGNEYWDRGHSLNRFISYHILDSKRYARGIIPSDFYNYYVSSNPDIFEYSATLCPNTLIEFRNSRDGSAILINRPTAESDNDTHTRIVDNLAATLSVSFVEIDHPIYYNEDVEARVFNKRMRMDVANLVPELITNNLRFGRYMIPSEYFQNLIYGEDSFLHYNKADGWGNMYCDEFLFTGKFDFTLKLLPIPLGTYEIRLGYSANQKRAVSQLFFDGKPVGIPLDMRMLSSDERIGWVDDTADEEYNDEIDKMMKNRGFMKGPTSIHQNNAAKTALRRNSQSLRRIITTETFLTTSTHEFRVKSVQENIYMQFHLDFMEIMPTSQLEYEGKD